MKIDRIKRDPQDEPKYRFGFFEIIIFFILIGGFFSLMLVKNKKEEFKTNNKNQIKVIENKKNDLDNFIKKSEKELIVES